MASALASDDVCEGQDCSLELHQLPGMKVNYLEALEDVSDEEEEAVQVEEEAEEEEAEVEGGGCASAADVKTWKSGGKKSFDAALNSCGRGWGGGSFWVFFMVFFWYFLWVSVRQTRESVSQ